MTDTATALPHDAYIDAVYEHLATIGLHPKDAMTTTPDGRQLDGVISFHPGLDVPVTALWLALAAVAAFAAGHYRLPGRMFDRALETATSGQRGGTAWAASVLLVLLALAVHPCRSIRHMRSWRGPEERAPAPPINPNWGKQ